jgi:hypothetical protein
MVNMQRISEMFLQIIPAHERPSDWSKYVIAECQKNPEFNPVPDKKNSQENYA